MMGKRIKNISIDVKFIACVSQKSIAAVKWICEKDRDRDVGKPHNVQTFIFGLKVKRVSES